MNPGVERVEKRGHVKGKNVWMCLDGNDEIRVVGGRLISTIYVFAINSMGGLAIPHTDEY